MSELPKAYYYQFTDSDTAGVDTDFVTAGIAETYTLPQNLVVQNNASSDVTITVKVSRSGTVNFTKNYTIPSGTSIFLTELMNQVLNGGSTPDKITVAIGSGLGAGETVDCIGSGVEI